MKIVKESLYEMNQVPFTNQNRNEPITQQYPMNRLQYEDADKPQDDEFTEDDYIECKVCANQTHPKQFKHGVCKKCASEGHWVDAFGRLRKDSYADKKRKTDFEVRKHYLEEREHVRKIYESRKELNIRIGDVCTDDEGNLVKVIKIGKLLKLYPTWMHNKKLSKEDFIGEDLFYKTTIQDSGPYKDVDVGEIRYYPVDKYYSKHWRIDKYDPYVDPTDHDDWLLHQPDHDLYPDLY
jgi:hypothetical protein